MACYKPLQAWRGRGGAPVFNRNSAIGPEMKLPCGQCIGCRLEHSRQWAVRLMHEASLHDSKYFLTLTYSPEKLPADGNLNKKHFQDFMKRLRARFSSNLIRFFHCGEYGDKLGRPHYHCILYGLEFPDRIMYRQTNTGRLYVSPMLNDIWGHGFCVIGDVTFESCAYVARYVLKKVTGDMAQGHYLIFDKDTGEVPVSSISGEFSYRTPEYVTMSRRPGIARAWYESFSNEVFPSDEVISRGFPVRPPRYYDKLFSDVHPDIMFDIKSRRLRRAISRAEDSTPARLFDRERCAKAKLSLYKRPLDDV